MPLLHAPQFSFYRFISPCVLIYLRLRFFSSSDSSLILNSPRIYLNNFKRGSYLSYDLQCINSCLRFSKFKWIWESVSFFNLVASNYFKNLFNCTVKVALTKIILGISWFDSSFSYYFTYIVFMYDWITSPYPESKKVSATSITRKQLLLINTSIFFLCLLNLSIVVIRMSTPPNSFSFSWEYFFEFDKEYIINLAKCEIFFLLPPTIMLVPYLAQKLLREDAVVRLKFLHEYFLDSLVRLLLAAYMRESYRYHFKQLCSICFGWNSLGNWVVMELLSLRLVTECEYYYELALPV